MAMFGVCVRTAVQVVSSLAMHFVVQLAMSSREDPTHLFVARIVGTRANRIDVCKRTFDLFEDGAGICGRVKA